ncbi:ATPase associated with various cellular activities AAA_3 [Thermaerobacter marianensis DSM 12885]|uniref:ATPase associated with various cellular activities AAA_3 n=1 Tax=Thermaerobacter marianensis (strain ATCC 700841 / DSM 12885 / JCM 10246 / 7p75a) TaxID=644966 RepID=E6SIR0_THEM7|nr:MoxR family ATPase [Thermaerobacter marianensis]ADU52004.1 ATPase associated with various cellular activities AAA_3 [Thermaerobacter marianensis DSM 12885]
MTPGPVAREAEDLAQRLERLADQLARVRDELQRVILGQDDVVRQVLWALLAGGHVLLEGVPGLGKTALVRALGQVLGLQFSRIQFTPDLMPADLLGTHILEERPDGRRGWRWEPGPIWAHLVLADEINRATPKTQSALLEAMAEGQVTAGGTTRPLPRPFLVLATQNPLEMEGTFPLPEAQLDRFLFKVLVPYPSEDTLARIGRLTTGARPAAPATVAGGEATVREWMDLARGVLVADEVLHRAARLVAMTHPDHPQAPEAVRRFVRYGASPRGLQALLLGAKARALMEGRLNVAYDDLAAVLRPALRHRLILNFEAEAAGIGVDDILAELAEAAGLAGVQGQAPPGGRGHAPPAAPPDGVPGVPPGAPPDAPPAAPQPAAPGFGRVPPDEPARSRRGE